MSLILKRRGDMAIPRQDRRANSVGVSEGHGLHRLCGRHRAFEGYVQNRQGATAFRLAGADAHGRRLRSAQPEEAERKLDGRPRPRQAAAAEKPADLP